jgi:hypothetical protein
MVEVQVGYNGNDFIENKVTIAATFRDETDTKKGVFLRIWEKKIDELDPLTLENRVIKALKYLLKKRCALSI